MTEHTKEPWQVINNESLQPIVCHGDKLIASTFWSEDARRIVACVNACAGIPTDSLEDERITLYWQRMLLDKHNADCAASELRHEVDFLEAELSQYRWLIDQEWPVILDCYHQHHDRFKERIIAKMAEESKCQE